MGRHSSSRHLDPLGCLCRASHHHLHQHIASLPPPSSTVGCRPATITKSMRPQREPPRHSPIAAPTTTATGEDHPEPRSGHHHPWLPRKPRTSLPLPREPCAMLDLLRIAAATHPDHRAVAAARPPGRAHRLWHTQVRTASPPDLRIQHCESPTEEEEGHHSRPPTSNHTRMFGRIM